MKYLLLILSIFLLLQCKNDKTITVLGKAETEVAIDYVIVSCNVSILGSNKIEINKKTSKIAIDIQKVLKKYNIDKEQIITLRSEISKNVYISNKGKYSSDIRYKFPFKSLEMYDNLKNSLLNVDATEIDILEKHIINEDSLKTVIYQKAVQKAKSKAELFLEAMGSKITGITKILDSNYNIDEEVEKLFDIEDISEYKNYSGRPSLNMLIMEDEVFIPTTKMTKTIEASVAIQFSYE